MIGESNSSISPANSCSNSSSGKTNNGNKITAGFMVITSTVVIRTLVITAC